MNLIEKFKKQLAELETRQKEMLEKAMKSESLDEVRSLNTELAKINAQIEDIRANITQLEAMQAGTNTEPTIAPTVAPTLGNGSNQKRDKDPYSTLEYRTAFKDFVQRGIPIPADLVTRANEMTVTADIGAIIPTTVMSELIKRLSGVYGQLYNKVRKLNIKGGVKFPITDLKANFKWITETTVSDTQKAGEAKSYVEFSYNIGEIRVAQSLLSQVISLDVFESEITNIILEAYLEAMDKGIVAGTGTGQMLGITKDTRVTTNTGHTIAFTEEEFGDWTSWRKKLFSVIPLSKRGKGEFIFTNATVESNLLTMKDANNRPLFREATDFTLAESAFVGRFYGREVTLVESDVLADFATASKGDVVGIYWIPTDYAINTNLSFGMKRYFDEDKNEWINKGLTIVDGKMLDVSGCYLITKA